MPGCCGACGAPGVSLSGFAKRVILVVHRVAGVRVGVRVIGLAPSWVWGHADACLVPSRGVGGFWGPFGCVWVHLGAVPFWAIFALFCVFCPGCGCLCFRVGFEPHGGML